MADKVQANQSFRAGGVFIYGGQWYYADDPVVQKHPHLFTAAADMPVRTTAAVPGPVTAPPPAMAPEAPVRPAQTAPVAQWRAYVAEVDPDADVDNMTKAELRARADRVEAGG